MHHARNSWILLLVVARTALPHPLDEYTNAPPVTIAPPLKRLQGVAVKGRLMCGSSPLKSAKVKIVDMDPRPDLDDLLGETKTDDNGFFQVAGATKEETDIEVLIKVYHDCNDSGRPCQRKVTWLVPPNYYNNGTLTEWFDVGSVNMELVFQREERDCRH
ncbi:Protein TTR-40 [Aphelenchoides avenae]|nr:Protein TTR-40 [Aphelenchus avenae]